MACSTVIARSPRSMRRKIYPVFEKRFPGIKINHVDATSDKLSARAITEARGGKTFADVVEFGLEDINKIYEQGLILEKVPPEVAAYPANLRGSYWAANNLIFSSEHGTRHR